MGFEQHEGEKNGDGISFLGQLFLFLNYIIIQTGKVLFCT